MKITAKKYAEALLQAAHGKSESEIKQMIKNLVGVLADNKDLAKSDKVMEYFSKMWNEKEGIIEAQVTTAEKLDHGMVKMVEEYIMETTNSKKVVLKEKVDKSILGGIIIAYGDNILDGSIKAKLRELKNTMIK